jgi:hypothetical protein
MKYYDFKLAKKIIQKNAPKLEIARMGTASDWYWTSERVFENGRLRTDFHQIGIDGESEETDFDGLVKLGGIVGSDWDTPILVLEYKNGGEKTIPIWTNEKPSRLEVFEDHKKRFNEMKKKEEQKEKAFEYTIGGL